MTIEVLKVDYSNKQQAEEINYLLNNYAEDPMEGGESLPNYTKKNLANELAKIPHAFSVICYVDEKPAGLVNGFMGFSTFKCKPLVNVYDLGVSSEFRGLNISQLMLQKVEEIAKQRGACKITLEVLEGNVPAKNSYMKFGFEGYELDPEFGKAMFWQKSIE